MKPRMLSLSAGALLALAPVSLFGLSTDSQNKLVQLISGLEDKASELRQQGAAHPELGLGPIADSLEKRVNQLKNAGYSDGSNLFGDAAAYVSVGNAITVTPNFFSGTYSDAERQAILLHEAVHLDQSLWEKKLKVWGTRGEAEAYKEEYKWLNVLGVGTDSKESKYEIFNVLQGLNQDYGVIPAEDKTQGLDQELGLTKDQLTFFNTGKVPAKIAANPPPPPPAPPPATPTPPAAKPPPPSAPATPATTPGTPPPAPKLLAQENKYFSFSIPDSGWKVSYGDAGSAQERYVFLIKEADKQSAGGGAIVVTYGVRLTLGEVLGADYFNPGVEKARDSEMDKDQKWFFSPTPTERSFAKTSRKIAGTDGLGYRKTETSKSGDTTKTLITERLYFKVGRKYYYVEQFYDTSYQDQITGDAEVFMNTLRVKDA
jgi:hypothetical protein